jgi:hypothetical protein
MSGERHFQAGEQVRIGGVGYIDDRGPVGRVNVADEGEIPLDHDLPATWNIQMPDRCHIMRNDTVGLRHRMRLPTSPASGLLSRPVQKLILKG